MLVYALVTVRLPAELAVALKESRSTCKPRGRVEYPPLPPLAKHSARCTVVGLSRSVRRGPWDDLGRGVHIISSYTPPLATTTGAAAATPSTTVSATAADLSRLMPAAAAAAKRRMAVAITGNSTTGARVWAGLLSKCLQTLIGQFHLTVTIRPTKPVDSKPTRLVGFGCQITNVT